jgi:hypothetical protein
MLSLRYYGEFKSKSGALVRCEILQHTDGIAFVPKVITFPADEPLIIEWKETDKLEPIQSSTASLKLVSVTDRQFVDMYSIEVGTIRLDVYKDGELYWSGTLDPELYEEPYSYLNEYEVTLTFSDFAILDRLDCDLEGIMTMQEIVNALLNSASIAYNALTQYISTYTVGNPVPMSLTDIKILCSNFYDEDNEPITLKEVLEAILKPYALRIVQKAGKVFIYDFNAVYSSLERRSIVWSSDDAVLGVDSVYNRVVLTFSPYSKSDLITGGVDYDTAATDEMTNYLYKSNSNPSDAERQDSFTIQTGNSGKGVTLLNGARFFRINPLGGANEEAGICWGHKALVNSQYTIIGNYPHDAYDAGRVISDPIIEMPACYIGKDAISGPDKYRLRINLQILYDVRYNPFEDASDSNDKAAFQFMKDWCNFAYIPFLLTLRDADGNAICHYENVKIMLSSGYTHSSSNSGWVAGEGDLSCAYLAYYDYDNRKSATGLGGWAKNKRCIGYYRDGLPGSWKNTEDGEYIEMPSSSGWLELKIGSGIHQFDYKREAKGIWPYFKWMLYKEPTVTLLKNGVSIENKDIEDSAYIDKGAKEKLEIETIVGTMPSSFPSARGIIYNQNMDVQAQFVRAGVTNRLERLLIGTAYSQYRGRHTVLSGTAEIADDFCLFTDKSQAGVFALMSDVQDLMEGDSDMKFTQIETDNYTGIEYE